MISSYHSIFLLIGWLVLLIGLLVSFVGWLVVRCISYTFLYRTFEWILFGCAS